MEIEVSPDGFIAMLRHLNGGATIEELDKAIINGLQAINDNGGKAEITFKVKLSHTAGLEHTITIEDDVTTKLPKEKRPNSLMFETEGYGLATQYQDQQALPLVATTEAPKSTLTPTANNKVSHLGAAK